MSTILDKCRRLHYRNEASLQSYIISKLLHIDFSSHVIHEDRTMEEEPVITTITNMTELIGMKGDSGVPPNERRGTVSEISAFVVAKARKQTTSRKKNDNEMQKTSIKRCKKSVPIVRQQVKKQRLYEIQTPFQDKVKEKKRICAIRAKQHRDSSKALISKLEMELADVIIERDILRIKTVEMQRKVEKIHKILKSIKQL
ncbi:hypothetical protein SK128_021611 [Halocaridina rubra]|uniref:Uncharacterized protein n=1 Tax=Halocaridina rubra TaxID=373956 RepID=A0AAN8XAF8_HALRR